MTLCSCDRPMALDDGDCLKCGRETPEHAELMRVGRDVAPTARRYAALLQEHRELDVVRKPGR